MLRLWLIKNDCNVSWEYFDNLPENKTLPDNDGNLMLPYFSTESTPVFFNPKVKYNFCVEKNDTETKIRAILESQAINYEITFKLTGRNIYSHQSYGRSIKLHTIPTNTG